MPYLVNPSGRTVGVDNEELIKQLLSQTGFREATQEEVAVFRSKLLEKIDAESAVKREEKEAEPKDFDGVFLASVGDSPDGYGQSRVILQDSLSEAGLNVATKYSGQQTALIYSYPYRLKEVDCPNKLIYTMFESTTIPAEWNSYLELADKVFVPSKFCQKAFLTRGIKSEVIPLGYDDKIFTYKEKKPGKPFTFLHFNSFNTRKGWDIVFNAFTEEFGDDENVKMILKTTKEKLPFPIMKSQYPNIEVIKAEYTKEKLRDLLYSSDCFVFPSRGEGFGCTPLEAMATGTPTIIPNGSGMSEYFNKDYFYEIDIKGMCPALYANFHSGDTGEMIEPDKDSLRKQMRYVFEHQEEAIEKAKKGAVWVKENYPISKTGKLLSDAIKEYQKTVVKQEKQADVNFVSLFWSSNGMGRVGQEVLLSLDKMGIDVKAIPDYLDKENLQPRTLEILDKSNSYKKADTTLYYAVPTILPRHSSVKNFLHIDWDTTKAPKQWVEKINKYISKVYPSSEFVKDVFEKSGITVPMEVIRHGVRTDRFPFVKRNNRGKYTFLTCGDISRRKGTDALIEAFQVAFPDNKDVKLVIKSNHDLDWGKIKLPKDDRIEVITERYAHEDFLKLYKSASCYVAPSRAEGFCLPAVEAMSTGLPTIIHNWSGMTSLCNDKYNFPISSSDFMKAEATFYPSEYGDIGDWRNPDIADLAEKMRYVYENKTAAKRIGEKSSEWVAKEFNWDDQVRKMWFDMAESTIPKLPEPTSKSKTEKEWGEFYEKSKVTPKLAQFSANAHKELFWTIEGFYPDKIIEAGCGPATMSAFLSLPDHKVGEVAITNHKIKEIVAMDNDEGVLKVAAENLKEFGECRLLNDDAFTSTEKADVVFAQGMLEHWDDDKMRELITNQLKQAEIVVHSMPNNNYRKHDFGNERLLTDEQLYRIFEGFDLTIYRYWFEDDVKKMSILVFKNVKNRPKTSIIMPVFNNKDMTIKAIEAVRKTAKDYELIVIDNHSTDGISEWLDEQKDIRTVHLCVNLGVPGAKNLGMALAKGEYICFLDNDTVAGEGWLDELLDVFKDKTVGFTGTDGYWIDKEKKNFLGTQFTHDTLVEWMGHSIFVFPRRLIREIGMLKDTDLWCIEDVDQCCRIRSLGYKGMMPKKKPNMIHYGGTTANKMTATLSHFEYSCSKVWDDWGKFIAERSLDARIDVGSGDNPMLGYVHVDVQNVPHVDIISLADNIDLPDSSVGEIYSSHLAEHFTQSQFDTVLQEWRRVLKDGGIMTIKCPNILTVCKKLLNKEVDYNLGVAWIYGGQRTKWDYHYWEYSFDSMKEKLERNGFTTVEDLPDVDDWLKVRAVCKKDVVKSDNSGKTKVLFKGNHHHILGGGENMTFGVIKMLDELYDTEIDIDLTQVDAKKGFDIDLNGIKKKSDRKNDVFVVISHFSLPKPEGKKNIAVCFYPQYDWKEGIKQYDKIVAISKYSSDAIKSKWGVDSVIIPPSIDISKFRIAEKKKQIISVGRFFWQAGGNNKNQHILIKAFSQMPKDYKLVLVGSVQNQEYYSSLKKMAKGINVEFIHDISFDELVKLYAESELFWSATGYDAKAESSQEHFGMVAVEALASGCRTLVYNGGGMSEITGVETWKTIDDLVRLSLEKTEIKPEDLAIGVKKYSHEVVKEQWRDLISKLC
jgi:glycosyltransferase involved in cell wall biosynthesis/GT2 family glycosyltransferase